MKSKFPINLGSKFGKLKGYLMLLLAAFLVLSIIRNIGKIVQIRSEVARERAKTEKQKRLKTTAARSCLARCEDAGRLSSHDNSLAPIRPICPDTQPIISTW